MGALWVVCGSIRERNYRLKKKNYLSGPTGQPKSLCKKGLLIKVSTPLCNCLLAKDYVYTVTFSRGKLYAFVMTAS